MFNPYLVPHLVPLFAMILLTFVVMGVLGYRRMSHAAKMPKGYAKLMRAPTGVAYEPPAPLEQASRNFINLFEMPVLFYAATFLTLELRVQDEVTLACSWGFVVGRLAHSAIHLTRNKVLPRFAAYMLANLCLAAFWIYLAVRVFFAN